MENESTETTAAASDEQDLVDALNEAVGEADPPEDGQEAQPEEQAAVPEGEESGGEQPGEQEEQGEQAPLEPPVHWDSARQELFGGLPRNAQEAFLEIHKGMEAEHTRRSQEIAPIRKVASHWEPYLQQVGATADRAFNHLMELEYGLRTGTNEQKKELLRGLIHDYGVDVEDPAQADPNDPGGLRAEMRAAISEQIGPLRQRMDEVTGGMQNQAVASIQQQVDAFKAEKGEDGKPAHPYFDEVRKDMATLAQAEFAAGRQPDMATLYANACWVNPSVREKMQIASQRSAQVSKRRTEQERARKARVAAGGLGGSGGGRKDQPTTIEEDLEAALKEASGS